MAHSETAFPAIRACIFDLDGLLINSEDMITLATNQLLEKYGRPAFTPSIRAQLMEVPDSTNGDLFHNWAKLPIPQLHATAWRRDTFVSWHWHPAPKSQSYELKISRPETKQLLSFFQPNRRVLGDDPRVGQGRGKPAPDIYFVALQSLKSDSSRNPILPSECLVFEDSVAGVEAGRRAGMRVVWVPHPDVAAEYEASQKAVLAGKTGMIEIEDSWQVGEVDDGWSESISSLEHFNYEKYGIDVRS